MRSTLLTTLFACFCAASAKPSYSRSDSLDLWIASWNGNTKSIQSIINSGDPDVNWRNTDDDDTGHTALQVAAKRGHVDAVSILLNVDSVDIALADSSGMTALKFAELNKHDGVVAALKRWNFKNNNGDNEDETATANNHKKKMDEPVDLNKPDKPAGKIAGGSWFSSWFGGSDDASVSPEM